MRCRLVILILTLATLGLLRTSSQGLSLQPPGQG